MNGRRGLLLPKACLVGLSALLASWAPQAAIVEAPTDRPGLALVLGRTMSGHVGRDDFVWAPSSGALADYLVGRAVLFSAAAKPGRPRDVFASCARVFPNGRVRSLAAPLNLSGTAQEDDSHLISNETHAAFIVTEEQVVAAGVVSFPSSLLACSIPPYSLKALNQHRYSFHPQLDEVKATLLPQVLRLKADDGAALTLPLSSLPATREEAVELPGIREKAALKALGVPELLADPNAKARVWRRSERVGAVPVEITTIDAPSFHWRVIPGGLEPFHGERIGIAESERAKVAIVITLGRTSEGTRYGLGTPGKIYLPFRVAYPSLKLTDGVRFGLLPAGIRPELADNEEAVQLPLVVGFGEPTSAARSHGTLRERGALCVQPGGTLLLAHAREDSSLALAQALANVGCSAAFELDRGSQDHARVFLRGSGTPPAFPYEVSVLVGLD